MTRKVFDTSEKPFTLTLVMPCLSQIRMYHFKILFIFVAEVEGNKQESLLFKVN